MFILKIEVFYFILFDKINIIYWVSLLRDDFMERLKEMDKHYNYNKTIFEVLLKTSVIYIYIKSDIKYSLINITRIA